MVQWHMKSNRKFTGGRSRTHRRSTKQLVWRGGVFAETKLADKEERIKFKTRGNTDKNALSYAMYANVTDSSTKTSSKAKILSVFENKANRQFARRNIITKGAILEVDLNGKKHVRVTSRPGQDGVINAILIEAVEEKKKVKKQKPRTKKELNKIAKKGTKKEKESKKEKTENKKEEAKEDTKAKEDKKEKLKEEKKEERKEIKEEKEPKELTETKSEEKDDKKEELKEAKTDSKKD